MAKIERILSRPDGSEARIVAQEMFGAGLHRSIDVYVHRRESPQAPWVLMSDRPAPGWREMPLAQYEKEGRSPMLQTVSPGELLSVTQELNRLTQPGFRIQLQERRLSSFPATLELVDDPEALDCNSSNQYAQLVRKLMRALDQVPGAKDVVALINPSDYPQIAFPDSKITIPITVLLMPSHELMNEIFCDCNYSGDTLGQFLIQSHGLDEQECAFAQAHRIVIGCDEDYLLQCAMEIDEETGLDDKDIHHLVFDYLATFTHELFHATEFIEHTHGLTPHDVDLWNDEGSLNFGIREACNGLMIRIDMQEPISMEEADQIMEDRVEGAGRSLLSQCLNVSDFKEAFNNYVDLFESRFRTIKNQQREKTRTVQKG